MWCQVHVNTKIYIYIFVLKKKCLGRGNQGQKDRKSFGLKHQHFLQGPSTHSHFRNNEKPQRRPNKACSKGPFLLLFLQTNSAQISDWTFQDSLEHQGHRHGSKYNVYTPNNLLCSRTESQSRTFFCSC